jgi:hypothetical protein
MLFHSSWWDYHFFTPLMEEEMTVSENPGFLEQFRRTPWQFQQTFQTPLQNLRPFVETILSANEQLQDGCVTIDQVVFEPKHLMAMLAKHSLPVECGHGWSLAVAGRYEVEAILEAALSDWVDFLFVPTPEPFVIYVDHDECTTFYAGTRSNLDRVVDVLSANGFAKVPGYKRQM